MKWILKYRLMISLIGLCIFLVACSSSSSSDNAHPTSATYSDGAISGIVEYEMAQNDSVEMAEVDEKAQLPFTERKVIYHATLSIEVENYREAVENIERRVKQIGGYVVNSSSNKEGEKLMSGYMTVRVPQAQFQSFLDGAETEAIEVNERYVEGNDVTEEYIDLESRLRAKKIVETRLLEFMDKAENTESLLKVSSDLASVQEEIEQITGRMKYLDNHVDYSTVTIYLHSKIMSVSPIQSEQLHTWTKAKSLFMNTINGLISFFSALFVGVIGLSPLLLPLVLITGAIIFMMRKRKKKQNEQPPQI